MMERRPAHDDKIRPGWADRLCIFFDDLGEVLHHVKLTLFEAFLLFSFGYTLYVILISSHR